MHLQLFEFIASGWMAISPIIRPSSATVLGFLQEWKGVSKCNILPSRRGFYFKKFLCSPSNEGDAPLSYSVQFYPVWKWRQAPFEPTNRPRLSIFPARLSPRAGNMHPIFHWSYSSETCLCPRHFPRDSCGLLAFECAANYMVLPNQFCCQVLQY